MMAGQIRLFEKTADGFLVEVPPSEAEARRAGRTVSHMSLVIDVLWTADEEAARAAEEQEVAKARQARAQALADVMAEREKQKQRAEAARAKIEALGLTEDDLRALLG